MSKEEKKGWLGSILIHLVIGVLLIFWRIDVAETETEFLEVSWGNLSGVPVQTAPSLPSSSRSAGLPQTQVKATVPVDLPLRQLAGDNDVLPIPHTRKLTAEERSTAAAATYDPLFHGEKGSGVQTGAKERLESTGDSGEGKANGSVSSGNEGTDVGRSVGYSVQWGGGGNRKLLIGDLPEYPQGANTQAQIKLEATVLPNGRVQTVRPVQKANTRLEDAALGEVRLWVFEPLAQSVPQREQTCVITFNFVLR